MAKEMKIKKEKKTKATVVLNSKLWREFKKKAIDKDINVSELFEKLVTSHIRNSRSRH